MTKPKAASGKKTNIADIRKFFKDDLFINAKPTILDAFKQEDIVVVDIKDKKKQVWWPAQVRNPFYRDSKKEKKLTYVYIPQTDANKNSIFNAALRKVRLYTPNEPIPEDANEELLLAFESAKHLYNKKMDNVLTESDDNHMEVVDEEQSTSSPTAVIEEAVVEEIDVDEEENDDEEEHVVKDAQKGSNTKENTKKRGGIVKKESISAAARVSLRAAKSSLKAEPKEVVPKKVSARLAKANQPLEEPKIIIRSAKAVVPKKDHAKAKMCLPKKASTSNETTSPMSTVKSNETVKDETMEEEAIENEEMEGDGVSASKTVKTDTQPAESITNNAPTLEPNMARFLMSERNRLNLLEIWAETKISPRHSSFTMPQQVPVLKFDHLTETILSVEELEKVLVSFKQWLANTEQFKNMFSLVELLYIQTVMLPESYIYYYSILNNCNYQEAEVIYFRSLAVRLENMSPSPTPSDANPDAATNSEGCKIGNLLAAADMMNNP
uniref:PWWP domain-containing protein n=1 Tax=Rhabditophanes sp. KR3021 TaxID=114890 RepID=A0AC35TRP7_9BILA